MSRRSAEILATYCPDQRRVDMQHRWSRRRTDRGCAASLDKSQQDGERQRFMTRIRGVIEFHRQVRLPRQRTEPFTILADEAPKPPPRQLELDQQECGVSPGAGLDQLLDSCGLSGLTEDRNAGANTGDDFAKEIRCWFAR